MINYQYYILLGAILFVIGLIGFATRRNMIVMFLCTELMLQGVVLNLVGYNLHWLSKGNNLLDGQAFTIFLLVIAAAEAALAMALVMVLQRKNETLNVGEFAELKG